MKVILLASGRSFRMKPIADKNLLTFCGKTLVEHQLSALGKAGLKDVVIVGGKHNLSFLRTLRVKNMRLAVVEQKNLDDGMAGGVLSAERHCKKQESVIVVSANDVVDEDLYKKVARAKISGDGLIVAKKVTSYFPGGYLTLDKKGFIQKIVEKPKPGTEPSQLINIVIHRFEKADYLFSHIKNARSKKDDRYEVALQGWFSDGGHFQALQYDGFWQPVKFPWHVLALMDYFLKKDGKDLRKGKNVVVSRSAKIYGKVVLADGVKVFDNAVIQGPAYVGKNTVVGNNVLVRGSHIGNNCVIGFGSEVARSFLGDTVWLHNNYVGDSVIGNDVAFGAGTVTGNYRLDAKAISMNIKGEKKGSGLHKLGIITGDHIRVGINTSFMPGVTVGSNSFVGAGIVVGEDVPEGSFVRGEWKLKVTKNVPTT